MSAFKEPVRDVPPDWRVEHDRTAVEARHQQALETAIAGCIEKAAAEREQWRNEFHRQRERIATLEADLARVTQERDEARQAQAKQNCPRGE